MPNEKRFPLRDFKQADLSSFEPSPAEQRLADAYTRIQSCAVQDLPSAHTAWFVVGNQSFLIGKCYETAEEASWMCWMLAKALGKVQQEVLF